MSLHRYFNIHDYYQADRTDDGSFRVMLHKWYKNTATLWEFVDRDGETVLQVIGNRASFGLASIGLYLSLASSPRGGMEMFYLAVTRDINQALVVKAVPEAPTI